MSKKSFTMKNKKASKVYKCDGQLLRKIITDKGFMPTELSRMMDYCSDYLNSCTRKNKISDVCVKKLMGYRIFPQMYGVEGEIKVDEPKEVKIDKDDKETADKLNKRMDMINSNSVYGMFKSNKEALAQEAKEILNRRYGRLEKGVEGIDYGYGPAPKNPSYYAAGHTIAKGLFQLMQAAMDDLKHDREFKEMIKQAVKEAYEEL